MMSELPHPTRRSSRKKKLRAPKLDTLPKESVMKEAPIPGNSTNILTSEINDPYKLYESSFPTEKEQRIYEEASFIIYMTDYMSNEHTWIEEYNKECCSIIKADAIPITLPSSLTTRLNSIFPSL